MWNVHSCNWVECGNKRTPTIKRQSNDSYKKSIDWFLYDGNTNIPVFSQSAGIYWLDKTPYSSVIYAVSVINFSISTGNNMLRNFQKVCSKLNKTYLMLLFICICLLFSSSYQISIKYINAREVSIQIHYDYES